MTSENGKDRQRFWLPSVTTWKTAEKGMYLNSRMYNKTSIAVSKKARDKYYMNNTLMSLYISRNKHILEDVMNESTNFLKDPDYVR